MANVTLTTVVRNVGTLPLLLKLTDKLVSSKLLTSLRIIDETKKPESAFEIRAVARVDGDTQSSIPHVDVDAVIGTDPKAFRGMKMEGYYHHYTNQKLFQNSVALTVGIRGGGIIGLTSQDNRKFEVVFDAGSCCIRSGRGGGSVLAVHPESGLSCGGLGWKLYKLEWRESELIVTAYDTGATFTAQCPRMDGPLDVTATALAQGACDIVVTHAAPVEIISKDLSHRSYVSYHTSSPAGVDGTEVISKKDIVYIDIEGWALLQQGSVPLTVGDENDAGAFRRSGVIQQSKTEREVHTSFLSRSKGVVGKIKKLRDDGIKVQSSLNSIVQVASDAELGTPVLFAVLSQELADDAELLAEYSKLIDGGPQGEPLVTSAQDILIYLDSLVADPKAMVAFLNEVVEALPQAERKYLHDLLSRSSD